MKPKTKYEGHVDGHRVVFLSGIGWTCDCEGFRGAGECEHIIKAAALLTWERPMRPPECPDRSH